MAQMERRLLSQVTVGQKKKKKKKAVNYFQLVKHECMHTLAKSHQKACVSLMSSRVCVCVGSYL